MELIIIVEKLHTFSAIDEPSVVQERPAQSKATQSTAADILGLNRQRTSGKQKSVSLEMEVNQYLNDPNQGSGILEYWQVVIFFMTLATIFSLIYIVGT
jgi:hypothetical protein